MFEIAFVSDTWITARDKNNGELLADVTYVPCKDTWYLSYGCGPIVPNTLIDLGMPYKEGALVALGKAATLVYLAECGIVSVERVHRFAKVG
jgi:hypothetical protein